jgi:hypothetical protein
MEIRLKACFRKPQRRALFKEVSLKNFTNKSGRPILTIQSIHFRIFCQAKMKIFLKNSAYHTIKKQAEASNQQSQE